MHIKSHYSLGVGTASIPDLVQHAGRLGLRALALTDLENLYGQVQFHAACRASGIKPLTGVELRPELDAGRSLGRRSGRLVLLARNATGYSRLCRIVTARRSGTPSAELSLASLGALDGLFLLTDDVSLLNVLGEAIGPEYLRALLVRPQPNADERELVATAKRLATPLVADVDAVMLHEGEQNLHRLLAAVHLGRRVDDLPPQAAESGARTFRAGAEVARLFSDRPDALLESERIAEMCSVEPLERRHLSLTAAFDAEPELERRCHDLLSRLPAARGARRVEYSRRLADELTIVRQLGLTELFSSVAALVEAARERSIPVAARGSAVSSLIGHVLGFSRIDPVEHGLYFERFVNAARVSPPDVDLDVASRRRDELMDVLIERRGPERAARISAVHTFQRRAAHREGLRALGAAPQVIREFLLRFPPDELADAGQGRLPAPHLAPPLREELPLLAGLVGKPRHLSLHPGGVALANAPLTSITPLERTAHGLMTQYDAESLSRLGLTKVDLLGNHCLDEVDQAFRAWSSRRGSGALAPATLDAIPLDDAPTFEMVGAAQTLGCFQLESPALRAVLARLPVRALSDVAHALAIVRPGPASGRAKELFLMRARGEVSEPALHAAFRERLGASHGLLLYEEDILFVLSTLSGIPLAAAEALRVRLGERSDDHPWLERARVRLVRRAAELGFPLAITEGVWSDIVRFVRYSFNKAHATSQALLAYQVAYLKRHAPLEHACAVLDHHGGLYPRRVIAADLSRRGILLLPPCVLRSSLECTIEPCNDAGPTEGVRIGIALLSGLRAATRERLLRSRANAGPFSGAEDLLRRARPRGRELRALVLSGACDALLELTPADYPWVHQALAQCLERGDGAAAEATIREAREQRPREPTEMVARYRALRRLQNELAYLEMHLSAHPLALLRSEARQQGCVPSHALSEHVGREVAFAGVVAAARSVPIGASNVLQYMTLEDEHGLVEARLAPAACSRLHARLTTPGPFLVRARVEEQQGVLSLAVQDLFPFHQREGAWRASSTW